MSQNLRVVLKGILNYEQIKNTMMKKKFIIIIIPICCLVFSSCGIAEKKGLDEDAILDTHLSSTDLRATSQQMARSIVTSANILSNKPTIIGFAVIENRTGDLDFDSYNLLDKIRQLILEFSNRKLQFVDRASINRIVSEKRWKEINTENYKELKKLLGIDYFLTGTAFCDEQSDSAGESKNYRLSFRLVDTQDGRVIWEDDYPVKKYLPVE